MPAPIRADFKDYVIGDDWSFDIEVNGGLTTAGASLSWCVKRRSSDPDPGLMLISSVTSGVTIHNDTTATLTFPGSMTDLAPAHVPLYHEIKLYNLLTGAQRTLYAGRIVTQGWAGQRVEPATIIGNVAFSSTGESSFVADVGHPGRDISLLEGLLHHWEPSASTVTLNGGNASQLDDRVGGKHVTQATAGNQPAYSATGGPNGRPAIIPQGAARLLSHVALGIADGQRLGIYSVSYFSGGPVDAQPFSFYKTSSLAVPVAFNYQSASGTGKFAVAAKETGVSGQNYTLNSPAVVAGWHKTSIEFLATGLEGRINGGPITKVGGTNGDPAFTGSAAADSIDYVSIGSASIASGTGLALLLVVADIDVNTAEKRARVDAYIAYHFGL